MMGDINRYYDDKVFHLEMTGDFEGEWIDVRSDLPLAVMLQFEQIQESDEVESVKHMANVLSQMIADWSFTDGEEPLPPNKVNIYRMNRKIMAAVMTRIAEGFGSPLAVEADSA